MIKELILHTSIKRSLLVCFKNLFLKYFNEKNKGTVNHYHNIYNQHNISSVTIQTKPIRKLSNFKKVT